MNTSIVSKYHYQDCCSFEDRALARDPGFKIVDILPDSIQALTLDVHGHMGGFSSITDALGLHQIDHLPHLKYTGLAYVGPPRTAKFLVQQSGNGVDYEWLGNGLDDMSWRF